MGNKFMQSGGLNAPLVGSSQPQQSAQSSSVGPRSLSVAAAASANMKSSIANTTNIDTLLVANENDSTHEKPQTPSELIQDKIAFIFNNLSLSNITPKSDELKDNIKDDCWEWVA
jgi:CCR4-NOT transcription complex subunit 1